MNATATNSPERMDTSAHVDDFSVREFLETRLPYAQLLYLYSRVSALKFAQLRTELRYMAAKKGVGNFDELFQAYLLDKASEKMEEQAAKAKPSETPEGDFRVSFTVGGKPVASFDLPVKPQADSGEEASV